MWCILRQILFPSPLKIPPSTAAKADDGGEEFTAKVELQGFPFKAAFKPRLGRPGFIDFPATLGERDLYRLWKCFAESVGDEQSAFAVL